MVTARIAIGMSCLLLASAASAQVSAKDAPSIAYGHHHLNVTRIDEHQRFWMNALGGTPVKIGATENVKFPGVLVRLRQQAPTGGTKGTVVNHVGFQVPDLRALVDKVRAAGFPIVTKNETTYEEKDGIAFVPNQNTFIAFAMGPDETKVEFVENKGMTQPIALHHIHYFTPEVDKMRAWYVTMFDAKPRKRGSFETADLPGVNLTFAPSADPVVATKGRVLDHVGFEVKNLKEFCERLESMGVKFDRPFSHVADLNVNTAFLLDPWGTYIELTEGLDRF